MPMALQAKNRTSIVMVGKLIAQSGSNIRFPVAAEQLAQPDDRQHHRHHGEDAETAVDQVEWDMQRQGALVGDEVDVVQGLRQARQEDDDQADGADQREDAFHPRADRAVEHVERDVLLRRDEGGAGEEHDPDIGDRADLDRPGDGVVEHVARDDPDDEGDEHGREHRRRGQLADALHLQEEGCHRCFSWSRAGAYAPAFSIRSSMPCGQFLAKSECRNLSKTWVRKALTSGVVTVLPLLWKKPTASFSVESTPASLNFLATSSAASIAFLSSSERPFQKPPAMAKKVLETMCAVSTTCLDTS